MKKERKIKFDDPVLNAKLAKARKALKEFRGVSALEFLDRK